VRRLRRRPWARASEVAICSSEAWRCARRSSATSRDAVVRGKRHIDVCHAADGGRRSAPRKTGGGLRRLEAQLNWRSLELRLSFGA